MHDPTSHHHAPAAAESPTSPVPNLLSTDVILRHATKRWWLHLGLLSLTALLVLAAGMGWRDPWPPDEPRYALVAKELVDQGGDWLFPRRNGELYAEKPPLFIWSVAGAYAAGLPLRIAFLLPSFFAALGTLALVVFTTRQLSNRRTALTAGWALLVTLQFTVQGKWAQMDALLGLWTTLALCGLMLHAIRSPRWPWTVIIGAAMAAGVLTKGVGVLPLLMIIPMWWLRFRHRLPRHHGMARQQVAIFAITLILVAAWVIPLWIYSYQDPALAAFRDRLLGTQTVGRYFDPWHHHKPMWYYLKQIPVLWLPVTLLLPWLIPAWIRRLRRGDPRTTLLLGYAALALLFFSLSPGKRGVYVYPILPAFILAAAPLLPGLLHKRSVQITALALTSVLGLAVAAGLPPLGNLLPQRLHNALLDEGILLSDIATGATLITITIAIIITIVITRTITAGRLRYAGRACAAAIASGWILVGLFVLPALNDARYPGKFMTEAQALVGTDIALGMVAFREQFVLAAPSGLTTFGYDRGHAQESAEATRWLIDQPDRALLVPIKRVTSLGLNPLLVTPLEISHRTYWCIARSDAVVELPPIPTPPAPVGTQTTPAGAHPDSPLPPPGAGDDD